MKPRVLMTTANFRIVQGPYPYSFVVEKADGRDAIGKRRWVAFRVGDDQFAEGRFRGFVDEVGRALVLRAKRRRKS